LKTEVKDLKAEVKDVKNQFNWLNR
jgi:hypothetical protein